jgi:hypothetical protein
MSEKPATQDAEDQDKSMLDKIEEATGGTHAPAPRAGYEDEGNFEGIQDAQQAERG